MKLSEYAQYDALGLAELIAQGEVSVADVVDAAHRAIAAVNPRINALAESWSDEPLPEPVDHLAVPLNGVPFLIKDMAISMEGRQNDFGSRLARGLVGSSDSNLMRRFRQAGLVTLGRTAVPEFGISITTESQLYGPTRNPWDTARSSGGSSGGSAAAVAAGIVPAAHGTDGGGSIRVPSACTGLFGLKPTRGRISVGPVIGEAWNGLIEEGVVTRSVRDSAVLLDIMAGPESGDPFQLAPPERTYLAEVSRDPPSLNIALQKQPLSDRRSVDIMTRALESVADTLEQLGHRVEEVALDIGVSWDDFVEMNARFWSANTAAWIDLIAAGLQRPIDDSTLEPVTLAMYALGKHLSAVDLLEAMDRRNTITRHMGQFFECHDLLLCPSMADLPQAIGALNAGQEKVDGLGWVRRVFDHAPFSALANVSGDPAMSMPLIHDGDSGLPVGLQFTAGFGQEALLLRLAGQLERALPWGSRKPEIWAGAERD